MARNNRARERATTLKLEFEILRSLLDMGTTYIEVPKGVLRSRELKDGLRGLSERTGMRMDDPDHQKLILSTVFHHLYRQRAGGRPSNISISKFHLLRRAMRQVNNSDKDTVAKIVDRLIRKDSEITGWTDSQKGGLRKRLERIMDDANARRLKNLSAAQKIAVQGWLPKIAELRKDKRSRKIR